MPTVSSQFVWLTWNLFFVFLGIMIAFWKKPLSWIILGAILLILKICTAPVINYRLLLEIVPVLLVTIALLVYYGKNRGE